MKTTDPRYNAYQETWRVITAISELCRHCGAPLAQEARDLHAEDGTGDQWLDLSDRATRRYRTVAWELTRGTHQQ